MSGKRKHNFKQIKQEKRVIPFFRVILSEKSFSGIFLLILDDPLAQKVNCKVKCDFNIYATNCSMYNTLFWCDFNWII